MPALPGCLSQGKSIEELKVNIAEAIEGWLEVMKIGILKKLIKQAGLNIDQSNPTVNLLRLNRKSKS